MPVNSEHPEYKEMLHRWDLVRSIVHNKAQKYIRTVDINDYERSKQYKEDAILTNFTRLTMEGLTGLVFRKAADKMLPEQMQYLNYDASGTGLSLTDLAKYAVTDVQQTGRVGLLVDYPPAPEGITREMEDMLEFKARIKPYPAESIINWKTRTIGSKTVLCMVVLKEVMDKLDEDDGFEWYEDVQYRVLYLDDSGIYHQQVWDDNDNILETTTPLDADGQPFMHIPFHFIGSINNDWAVDPIPLYDLSVINLGHYRNSADYEESIFLNGQPTAILGGDVDPALFTETYGNNIKIGSRAAYFLGSGAKGEFMQPNPNQLADTAMKRKEEQAVSIGARLISPAGGRETAEAARIRYGSQNSALFNLVVNVSKAMEKALYDVAKFMGISDEPVMFELNKRFYEETADPQLIAQQMMLLDRDESIISKEEIRDYLKKTNVVNEPEIMQAGSEEDEVISEDTDIDDQSEE